MSSSSIIRPAVEQATTPLSPERLGEIDARAAHLYEYVQQPAEADVLAGQDVPALLSEVDRLQTESGRWQENWRRERELRLEDLKRLQARVAELEAERHTTNEALSDAAVALRDANTAAGLVAEYRVPAADGRWLSVRREPNGDRWAIFTSHLIAGRRRAWVDGRWQVLPAYGENGVWDFDSADAALAEAARLTENTPAVAS